MMFAHSCSSPGQSMFNNIWRDALRSAQACFLQTIRVLLLACSRARDVGAGATGQVGVRWGALAGSRRAGRLPQRGLLLRQARQLRCALSLARLQLGFTAAHRDAVGAAAHTSVQEASRHLLADL